MQTPASAAAICGAMAADIVIQPGGIGAGCDRLEANGVETIEPGTVEQGAGNVRFANFGVGAGQEVSVGHFFA